MKEKAQDPLAARSTSRPIFASVMGYRRSLVDTCKSSSVLVVSTLVAFMYLLCFCLVFAINRLCNDELSLHRYYTSSLLHQTLSLPLPWGWGRENGLGNLAALMCALQECL